MIRRIIRGVLGGSRGCICDVCMGYGFRIDNEDGDGHVSWRA